MPAPTVPAATTTRPSRRLPVLVAVGTTLAVLAAAGALWPRTTLWVNPDTPAAIWVAEHPDDGRADLVRSGITHRPTGVWLNGSQGDSTQTYVDDVVTAAEEQGARPLLVLYNIPHRDCADGRSSGGAATFAEYRAWVDQVVEGMGGRPAMVVVEPDILASIGGCLPADERAGVTESIGYVVDRLRADSPDSEVYLDAGHSDWLAPAEMAAVLEQAGVHDADGIATNVSNFRTTAAETAYARQVLEELDDRRLGAVIDTSRNGNGPGTTWCDPEGRAVGRAPTERTLRPRIDAYVWVKAPGEADGCAAPAGVFDPQVAYELLANA